MLWLLHKRLENLWGKLRIQKQSAGDTKGQLCCVHCADERTGTQSSIGNYSSHYISEESLNIQLPESLPSAATPFCKIIHTGWTWDPGMSAAVFTSKSGTRKRRNLLPTGVCVCVHARVRMHTHVYMHMWPTSVFVCVYLYTCDPQAHGSMYTSPTGDP